MISDLRELYKYRDLVKHLVIRDLKVRYKNSVLGFFWSLVNPLLQVATITIVVKYLMGVDIPNFSAYLLVGYLPWMYFQTALLDSSQVVLMHRDLLQKVYFPREVLPLSVVIANLVHFLLALVVFFAYLIIYIHFGLHGTGLLWSMVWLPLLIILETALIAGITFYVSCMNVFFEDTKYLLSALLNVLFYATPVMYVSELVQSTLIRHMADPAAAKLLYTIYLLNPLNALVVAFRKVLLPPFQPLAMRGHEVVSEPMQFWLIGVVAVVCVLVAISGYRFFNARKWVFAERA